jgi:HAD superfamily hydrolase (TIGR01509 family)
VASEFEPVDPVRLPTGIRAVIFDCDGVLADTEAAWGRAERAFCERVGAPFDERIRAAVWGHSLAETVRILMPGGGEPEPLDGYMMELEALAAEEVGLTASALPGAIETVVACAALVPIGVASNSPRAILDAVLRNLGIAHLVVASAAGDEVARGKPHPESYRRVVRALGVLPKEALAFDESLVGLAAARAAGCRAIHVTDGLPAALRAAAPFQAGDEGYRNHCAGVDTGGNSLLWSARRRQTPQP